MPNIPNESLSSDGKVPIPISVLATGICKCFANSVKTLLAPEATTPPPEIITGLLALHNKLKAFKICLGWPL